jgi:hypothetical protein
VNTRQVASALACLALVACTSSSTGGRITGERGGARWEEHTSDEFQYAVALPPGWTIATETLTPNLGTPTEILSFGTYGLRPGGDACAQVPVNALEDLGPTDAFATIQERPHAYPSDVFLDRPVHLESLAVPKNGRRHLEVPECLSDPDKPMSMWWIPFRDEGRAFYLLVAVGPDASDQTSDRLWEILDGIRFT